MMLKSGQSASRVSNKLFDRLRRFCPGAGLDRNPLRLLIHFRRCRRKREIFSGNISQARAARNEPAGPVNVPARTSHFGYARGLCLEDEPLQADWPRYSQQKRPWPAPGETVIKLEACGLNLEVDRSKPQ
jgi:hypothetical protein